MNNLGSNISVGYALSHMDEREQIEQRNRIKSILNDFFPNLYKEKRFAKNDEEVEIIYVIQCPIFDSELQKIRLLRTLKALFDETADLSPYFCKLKENDDD